MFAIQNYAGSDTIYRDHPFAESSIYPPRQRIPLDLQSYQSCVRPAQNIHTDSQQSIDQSVITYQSSTMDTHLKSERGGLLGIMC